MGGIALLVGLERSFYLGGIVLSIIFLVAWKRPV